MENRAFSKGTLLWVDDNFQSTQFRADQVSTDGWQLLFGGIENKVFRFLGLNLLIVTTYEQAEQLLDDYGRKSDSDEYLVAVVDLNIPMSNRKGNDKPLLKVGIKLAKKLKELEIPFYFLSSMSSALKDLKKSNLDSVPYFSKVQDDLGMMPESLARSILNDFRNKISWIDLGPLLSAIDAGSEIPINIENVSHRYFPFFGGFRDFVERWEYRPVLERDATLIIRSPRAHSDEFVLQCLILVLAQRIWRQEHRTKLRINFDNCSGGVGVKPLIERIEQHNHKSNKANSAMFIVRINDKKNVTVDEFAKLVNVSRHVLSIFVLPSDQVAEEYLDRILDIPRHIYDNLPFTHWSDRVARERLINKSCQFILQSTKLDIGEAEKGCLGQAYLSNPEILIHPANWTFLLDSEDVLDDISDPVEILEEFTKASEMLSSLDVKEQISLSKGMPINPEHLIRVGDRVFQSAPLAARNKWKKDALALWLNSSWQFPYGYEVIEVKNLNESDQMRITWEDQTLLVLANLTKDISLRELDRNKELDHHIISAKRFLDHKAIQSLLNRKKNIANWAGLESIRWPHLIFPMPAALNRMLKEEGRYLWVQSDFLDDANGIPSGQKMSENLERLALQAHARIEWLDRVIEHLPNSWKKPTRAIKEYLLTKTNKGLRTKHQKNQMWGYLSALMRNATPICLLFSYIMRRKPLLNGTKNAYDCLINSDGYGVQLQRIRGSRQDIVGSKLTLIFEKNVAEFISSLGSEFMEYVQLSKSLQKNGLGDDFSNFVINLVQRVVSEFNPKTEANDNISEQLMHFLSSKTLDLYKNDWFNEGIKLDKDTPEEHKIKKAWQYSGKRKYPSLYGARLDYVWHLLDALQLVKDSTYSARYFDGYHFLAALNDLRVYDKDRTPSADFDEVLELFLWGFEGIVAQLKYCIRAAGHEGIAEQIPLDNVKIKAGKIENEGLNKCIKIVGSQSRDYQLYSLGLVGEGTVQSFSTDDGSGQTIKFENSSVRDHE